MNKKQNKIQKSKKEQRPYRMINVNFPSAKYGLIVAIIIIIIFVLLEFKELVKIF